MEGGAGLGGRDRWLRLFKGMVGWCHGGCLVVVVPSLSFSPTWVGIGLGVGIGFFR